MRKVIASLLIGLSFVLPRALYAQECVPPPHLDESDISADTKASASIISKLFSKLILQFDYKAQVKTIFVQHPETMQWYVLLVAFYTRCTAIRDDKSLTSDQRQKLNDELYRSIVPAFSLTPTASTSPSLTLPTAPAVRQQGYNNIPAPKWHIIQVVAGEAASSGSGGLSWAERYLQPVPVVVTTGNQWWVDVGYAKSEQEGRRELESLKARFPNLDFALYTPFGRNSMWNIVLATWVSKSDADRALAEAKKVNSTSFEWRACSRFVGQECVSLDPKLQKALKLQRPQ